MVYTCEEAWERRHPGKPSVHLQQFPKTPDGWLDAGVAAKWEAVFRVRKFVTEALEVERREKRIGSSLEASVDVKVGGKADLDAFAGEDAAEIFITSDARLSLAGGDASTVNVTSVRVPDDWKKCRGRGNTSPRRAPIRSFRISRRGMLRRCVSTVVSKE